MPVYTVHEPPLRAADAGPDPERFLFVRDGFYLWAFLLTPLWMPWHRMWLVLLIYVAVAAGVENAMYYADLGSAGVVLVQLLISLLIGIEAGTLRRLALARRGWKNVGVAVGDDHEDAEQRFFDAWVRTASGKRAEPAKAFPAPPPSPLPRTPPSPGVIGLFPEPGANR